MMADSLTTAKGHPRTEKYDALGAYKIRFGHRVVLSAGCGRHGLPLVSWAMSPKKPDDSWAKAAGHRGGPVECSMGRTSRARRCAIEYVRVAPSGPVFQFGEIIDMAASETHSLHPGTQTIMLDLVANVHGFFERLKVNACISVIPESANIIADSEHVGLEA
jgi:hypothetical protein